MADDSVLLGQLAEEFSGRVRRGDLPAVEEYALRHPALAERIRALFPTLMLLDGMAGARLDGAATVAPGAGVVEGALAPGQTFNHYRIERTIGRGGMGVVYEATHLPLEKRVALKVLPVLPDEGARQLERFLREAKTAAGLHHTNIVPVFDIGQCAGVPYFAMQFIDGRSLDKLLESWQTSPPTDLFQEVARLGTQAADALAYAHQRGVIHRDIKPSNLLLDGEGVLWVTDFGLARRTTDVTLTQPGALVGTPRYMSPEQAEAAKRPVDHRTDVYSLGATLYELSTRRPPFEGGTPVDVLLQIIEREPLPPRKLNPAIPRDLETVILKAMAKRPEDRYPTAQELADDLRRFLTGEPVRARRIGAVGRLARWSRRNPVVAALVLTVLLTTTLGSVVTSYFALRAEDSARTARAKEREAQKARAEAEAHAAEIRRSLARQYVASGIRRMDAGDFHGALPWLVEGLALDADDPLRAANHRTRIGILLRQSPRLEQVWLSPGELRAAEFTPDASRVVTAGGDAKNGGWVRVWDARTGEAVLPPLAHERPVERITLSPDGRRLAALVGTTVHVWDLTAGKRLTSWVCEGVQAEADRPLFSPDGSRLAVTWDRENARDGWEQVVRIWDLATGKSVTQVLHQGDLPTPIGVASFSPDGRHLAVLSENAIRVWDAVTGRDAFPAITAPTDPTWVEYSPDGNRLLTVGAGGDVRLWDARTGKPGEVVVPPGSGTSRTCFAPDGSRILTVDGAVHFWETATGKLLRTLRPAGAPVQEAFFRADGLQVVTVSKDGSVRLWDAGTDDVATVLLRLPPPVQARLSPDGRNLLTTGVDGLVRLWDLSLTEPQQPLDDSYWRGRWGQGIDFMQRTPKTEHLLSPDGRHFAVYLPGRIRVWDVVSGQAVGPDLPSVGWAGHSFFSRDGRLMGRWYVEPGAAGTERDTVFRVLDVTTGQWRTGPFREFHGLAATNLEKGLAVTVQNDEATGTTVQVWDLTTGRPAFPAQRYAESVLVAALSDDGRLLLTVHDGTSGQVREAATGKPVGAARPLPGAHRHLAFSPSNDRVLCLSHPLNQARNEGRVELWEVPSDRPAVRLPQIGVTAAEFSPDGARVVTVAADHTARVWDAASGRPVTPPLEHREEIRLARFSRDGRHLLTATDSGGTRLWDVSTGEPLSPPLGGEVREAVADGDGRLVTVVKYSSVRVWDVSPETRSLDQLRLLSQVLSGSRPDDAGGLVQLDAEEEARAWQALRASGGPAEQLLRQRRLGWHAAEATRQEQARRPAAAVEYLTPLIDAQPHRVWLHARRGRALRQLRRWDQAGTDLTAALVRAEEDPALWIDRGHVRAEQGRWKEAADDFARADGAVTEFVASLRVTALVGAGDLPALRRLWASLFPDERHVDVLDDSGGRITDRRAERNALAWAALLRADAGLDLEPFLAALRNDATAEPRNADVRRTLGAASLHAGKPDEAINWLTGADALRDPFPSAWLLLAMAHHRAGHAKQAEEWWQKATTWLDEAGQLDRLDWQRRLELRLLREEAKALLKK